MFGDILKHGGLIISATALTISVYAVVRDRNNQRDASARDAIGAAYDKWLDVSRIQMTDWQIAHLFALPDQYLAVASHVRDATITDDGAKHSELLLRERGAAVYLFTLFESTLYQWQQAVDAGDTRADFYKAVLDYQTGRQLRNPRLLYLWDGGGLSAYFEQSTVDYYQRAVAPTEAFPKPDPTGPFN